MEEDGFSWVFLMLILRLEVGEQQEDGIQARANLSH